MKDSKQLSLAEAARRLRRLADDLDRRRVEGPEGAVRLPKGTQARIEVESETNAGAREIEVELELKFDEPGRAGKAKQALLGRSRGDWLKSGANLVLLLPALLTVVRFARSLKAKSGKAAGETRT